MSAGVRSSRRSLVQARADLHACLRARLPEIEEAVLTRAYSVADPMKVGDTAYTVGLRAAVSVALDYVLAGIEAGDSQPGPIPLALLAQARQAARSGVSLDTVLRRYLAGHTALGDFVIAEGAVSLPNAELQRLLRVQATLVDRLIAAVTEEYSRESQGRRDTVGKRRAARVERLLEGELLDTSELAYDFEAHHLGLVTSGSDPAEAVRELAGRLDCRLLLVRREEDLSWAWLGSRHALDPAELVSIVPSLDIDSRAVAVGFGEPGEGLTGWRLTHRQARAAHSIALRCPASPTRYADVALLASVLQDDLLCASLREIYLAPLKAGRDGGVSLRETLRAYFAADRNTSSAAACLGVSRQAVNARLTAIEGRLEHQICRHASAIELALRVEALEDRQIASFSDVDLTDRKPSAGQHK